LSSSAFRLRWSELCRESGWVAMRTANRTALPCQHRPSAAQPEPAESTPTDVHELSKVEADARSRLPHQVETRPGRLHCWRSLAGSDDPAGGLPSCSVRRRLHADGDPLCGFIAAGWSGITVQTR
jgi:hypothetical protein